MAWGLIPSQSESPGAVPHRPRRKFALAGETVAFEEVADGVWALHFSSLELGRFDERDDHPKA